METNRRPGRTWLRTAGALAGLAAVLLVAQGCGPALAIIEALTPGVRSAPSGWRLAAAKGATAATDARAAKAPGVVTEDGTLTFRAPADVPAPNSGEVVAPYDLVPPFRVECTVGLCDPAFHPAPGAVFGMHVVERTGALRDFAADCSRVGGITATATFGTPAPHAFAGADRLDLALDHDGTDLVAYARDHDTGGAWTEISRSAVGGAGPFLPKFAARDFDPGQMVSYYSLRVRTNAPYADGQATPQHQAVRSLAEALNDLADANDALAADAPDEAAALQRIEAANQRVADAVAALDAAAAGKTKDPAARKRKAARKAALKAAKGVKKALGTLDAKGLAKSKTVLKGLGKAALDIVKAGDQILPDDLRAALGGLTLKALLRK